jgi:hypothetical protein
MNGNQSTFQPIKFETDEFTFRIKNYRDPGRDAVICRVVPKVKNKSTQIKFSILGEYKKEIIQKYAPFMKGSKSLTVTGNNYSRAENYFPYSLLCNTYHVQLVDISTTYYFPALGKNIICLSVLSCIFHGISELPKGLQKLHIEKCLPVELLPSIASIPNVILRSKRDLSCAEFPRNSLLETFEFSMDMNDYNIKKYLRSVGKIFPCMDDR